LIKEMTMKNSMKNNEHTPKKAFALILNNLTN